MLPILRNPSRAGFTLVEMSVVIAIIGLLVGGVMAGASIIRSSELTTVMNESKLYINGFNNFVTKYGAPPGDLTDASTRWSGAHNGNGDGYVLSSTPAEQYYSLEHLSKAKMITAPLIADNSSTVQIGTNLPTMSVRSVTLYFTHAADLSGYLVTGATAYWTGWYYHFAVLARQTNGSALGLGGFLTGREAAEVDSKFDDGMPGLGSIRTLVATSAPSCVTGATADVAVYNTATTSLSCMFTISTR